MYGFWIHPNEEPANTNAHIRPVPQSHTSRTNSASPFYKCVMFRIQVNQWLLVQVCACAGPVVFLSMPHAWELLRLWLHCQLRTGVLCVCSNTSSSYSGKKYVSTGQNGSKTSVHLRRMEAIDLLNVFDDLIQSYWKMGIPWVDIWGGWKQGCLIPRLV